MTKERTNSHQGKNDDSKEQKIKKRDKQRDQDPERQVDDQETEESEKNPDDFPE
ncbi:hypothetical protein [Salibacterium aidingense]|uniref:hypothetical protein n=1 Tax=Salibacterium aidingense TaxID=384933 RepID=UPI003BE07A5C